MSDKLRVYKIDMDWIDARLTIRNVFKIGLRSYYGNVNVNPLRYYRILKAIGIIAKLEGEDDNS